MTIDRAIEIERIAENIMYEKFGKPYRTTLTYTSDNQYDLAIIYEAPEERATIEKALRLTKKIAFMVNRIDIKAVEVHYIIGRQ